MMRKRYEYTVQHLKLENRRPNEEQLIEVLNAFGMEGWRLNRIYGEVSLRRLATWKGGLTLLLEREVDDCTAATSPAKI